MLNTHETLWAVTVTCHSLCEHQLCTRPCLPGSTCQAGDIKPTCLSPTLLSVLISKSSQKSPNDLISREQAVAFHCFPSTFQFNEKNWFLISPCRRKSSQSPNAGQRHLCHCLFTEQKTEALSHEMIRPRSWLIGPTGSLARAA